MQDFLKFVDLFLQNLRKEEPNYNINVDLCILPDKFDKLFMFYLDISKIPPDQINQYLRNYKLSLDKLGKTYGIILIPNNKKTSVEVVDV